MTELNNLIIYFGALDRNGKLTLNSLQDYYDIVVENDDSVLNDPLISKRFRLNEVLNTDNSFNKSGMMRVYSDIQEFKDAVLFPKPIEIQFDGLPYKYPLEYENITAAEIAEFIKNETKGERVEMLNAKFNYVDNILTVYLYFNRNLEERSLEIV